MRFGMGVWMIVAVGIAGAQQPSRQAHLAPLPAARAHAAADKLANAPGLQTNSTPTSEEGQNFILHAQGVEDLTFIQGEADVHPTGNSLENPMQCGLYVLHGSGKAEYVSVVGPDFKPYSFCERLDALGVSADPGPRPRLIAEFFLRAAGGNHYDMPFVLTWDAGSSTYKVDYPTSFWLAKQPHGDTVLGARHLLAAHK